MLANSVQPASYIGRTDLGDHAWVKTVV
jgi:hypothetical protein